MHQRFFGESRDFTKRQLMEWLAPHTCWFAHPIWYLNRDEEPRVPNFLNCYATVIGVNLVVGGRSANPDRLLVDARACRSHLFLDSDTGLGTKDTDKYPHPRGLRPVYSDRPGSAPPRPAHTNL